MKKNGRISQAELRRIEDQAIRDVVKQQEDLGLEGVTDGEFRRASWHMDFLYQVGGTAKVQDNIKAQFRNEQGVHRVHARRVAYQGQAEARKMHLWRRLRVSKIGGARHAPSSRYRPPA